MLLKEDESNKKNLIYAGEAPIANFVVNEIEKELIFSVDNNLILMPVMPNMYYSLWHNHYYFAKIAKN